MFDACRSDQFTRYNKVRDHFLRDYESLVRVEQYMFEEVARLITEHHEEIRRDYNEASYLYPFWQNYPPEERGRQPVGDQYPWIEVGEHSIGRKLPRMLAPHFAIRDSGLPVGPDERFVLSAPRISELTNRYTDSVWLFADIKSVGPRDDAPHAVMSHNQVSGCGEWRSVKEGVRNTVVMATGHRTAHEFHCTIPPLLVLSDGTAAPVVHVVIKPVYRMLGLQPNCGRGQPLQKIQLACIPNGLLLMVKPNYLGKYAGLLFPGKDDKTKDPKKLRARVSFQILQQIANWRVREILFD